MPRYRSRGRIVPRIVPTAMPTAMSIAAHFFFADSLTCTHTHALARTAPSTAPSTALGPNAASEEDGLGDCGTGIIRDGGGPPRTIPPNTASTASVAGVPAPPCRVFLARACRIIIEHVSKAASLAQLHYQLDVAAGLTVDHSSGDRHAEEPRYVWMQQERHH
jgi:hypothetical protein